MGAYFLDSSAAVKVYVAERGTAWLRELVRPANAHEFFLVFISPVEIAAAIFRRAGPGGPSAADAATALRDLRRDLAQTYQLIEITGQLVDLGMALAERHHLRGYDCVQLAGALYAAAARGAGGLSPITLISADVELNAAARTEGLEVENPNERE